MARRDVGESPAVKRCRAMAFQREDVRAAAEHDGGRLGELIEQPSCIAGLAC